LLQLGWPYRPVGSAGLFPIAWELSMSDVSVAIRSDHIEKFDAIDEGER